MKTNWRMIERLFFNQGYEERSTQSQVEGEEKQSGPAALGGDTEEQMDITGSEILRGE